MRRYESGHICIGEQILAWLEDLPSGGSLEFQRSYDGKFILLRVRSQEKGLCRTIDIESMKQAYFDALAIEMEMGVEELKSALRLNWTGYEGSGL